MTQNTTVAAPAENASVSTTREVLWIDTELFTAMLEEQPRPPSGTLWLITRLGVAALLATNAAYAFASPDDFEQVLTGNPVGEQLGAGLVSGAVLLAGINDAVLALLVLTKRWQSWLWCWVGIWFAIIAATKLLNIIF